MCFIFLNQGFDQFQRTIAQNDQWNLRIIFSKKNLGLGSNYKFRKIWGPIRISLKVGKMYIEMRSSRQIFKKGVREFTRGHPRSKI